MKILIIIPAYNEKNNIENVVNNITTNYPQYDYLVVNDCSTDSTLKILQKNKYNYISLPINLGIGGGVQCGYIYATENDYDITIQLDGDGQHDPAYIKKLIQPIIDGDADITIGSRFIKKQGFQTSFLRRLGIKIISTIIRLCCGVKTADATSGFRASNKAATLFFSQNYARDYPEPEAIVSASLNNFRLKEVAVTMKNRESGTSSINTQRSIYYMIKVSLAIIVCRISTRKSKL